MHWRSFIFGLKKTMTKKLSITKKTKNNKNLIVINIIIIITIHTKPLIYIHIQNYDDDV